MIRRYTFPKEHPNRPPKNEFFEWFELGCQFFFDISRYLTEKYFDIVWEYQPPPPPGTPQNLIFNLRRSFNGLASSKLPSSLTLMFWKVVNEWSA